MERPSLASFGLASSSPSYLTRVRVVDSHTGGEPTRVVISGGPGLPGKSVAERLRRLRDEHDYFRTSVINEPRGTEIIVGALLCEPEHPSNTAGVIFFNNVGYLGMCVHGTIGAVVTLAHLGRIRSGVHRIESPVGVVSASLHDNNEVTVENVASYRLASNVSVNVPGFGVMKGDVAWGGNWFFLVDESPLPLTIENSRRLTDIAAATRRSLAQQGITGADGAEIDHIEFFAPSRLPGVDNKNFVLCPGDAYDRSPCGTGTSAKLACLYADGKLKPGQIWRQESIVGSVFEGSVRLDGNQLFPSIKGSAFITSEADLILDSRDPFRHGLVP